MVVEVSKCRCRFFNFESGRSKRYPATFADFKICISLFRGSTRGHRLVVRTSGCGPENGGSIPPDLTFVLPTELGCVQSKTMLSKRQRYFWFY